MSATPGIRFCEKQTLLAGVSLAALLLGSCLVSPALGAEYLVSNDTELRNAITSANADGDATATIKLTAGFSTTGSTLPTPTKPITIDTQGFAIGNLQFTNTGGQTLTIE